MEKLINLSRRVEVAYLGALRFVMLIIATIVVLTALFFLFDGARKLATSTTVVEAPIGVAPSEVISAVATEKQTTTTAQGDTSQVDSAASRTFMAFMNGNFTPYYNSYVALAKRYNKPEDRLLTRNELATGLGYTVDAYSDGTEASVRRFVQDAAYAKQLNATAAALITDTRVAGQLRKYQAAQKTAQSCSTIYQPRRVWDSSSTGCEGWWQSPVGCSVIRRMPVQQCVPAYPDGITSPAQAFLQMDTGFRQIWANKSDMSAAEANAKREKLVATKLSGGPTVIRAAYVFGAFLVIMFMFLIIAVERHLRQIAQMNAPLVSGSHSAPSTALLTPPHDTDTPSA
ncbi:MAG: hypothetical protein KAX56_06175 [Phenylobacterium sp.]|nr:hypothetical protein [Phenylobacterium sp.]